MTQREQTDWLDQQCARFVLLHLAAWIDREFPMWLDRTQPGWRDRIPDPDSIDDGTDSEPIDDLPPEDSDEADELASYAEGDFSRWIFRKD